MTGSDDAFPRGCDLPARRPTSGFLGSHVMKSFNSRMDAGTGRSRVVGVSGSLCACPSQRPIPEQHARVRPMNASLQNVPWDHEQRLRQEILMRVNSPGEQHESTWSRVLEDLSPAAYHVFVSQSSACSKGEGSWSCRYQGCRDVTHAIRDLSDPQDLASEFAPEGFSSG